MKYTFASVVGSRKESKLSLFAANKFSGQTAPNYLFLFWWWFLLSRNLRCQTFPKKDTRRAITSIARRRIVRYDGILCAATIVPRWHFMESEYIVVLRGKPCNSIFCRGNGRVPPISIWIRTERRYRGQHVWETERKREASNEDGECSLIRSRLR